MGTAASRGAAVALLILLLLSPASPAGDAAVARTLFDGGQKAFKARKYEEAASLWQKAWTEDPSLVEAVYWRGQAQEKLKDEPSALASYRQFLSLVRGKESEGLSMEERKLKGLARKRVDALAVAEREFKTLEDRYVATLAALMKAREDKGDADGALQVADRILEVSPDHPAARDLRTRLGADATSDPFAVVAEWKDLVKDQGFRGPTTFADGVMTMDIKSGGKLRANPVVRFDGGFGYETEFRATATYESTWSLGLSFGDEGDVYMDLRLYADKIVLRRGSGKQSSSPVLASIAMTTIDPAAWHSLGVLSRDGVVRGFFDGKQVFEVALAEGETTNGDIGIVQQGCLVERRVVRAGRIR